MSENVFSGILLIVLAGLIIFIIASAGYSVGTSTVAEFACLEQGFDAGEWVDGAIQCATYGVP